MSEQQTPIDAIQVESPEPAPPVEPTSSALPPWLRVRPEVAEAFSRQMTRRAALWRKLAES